MTVGTLQPGTVIAREFIVESLLGEGGMGAVYAVLQPSTGKRRALKVMLRRIAADPALQRRFEQEARLSARIASEHVVEVLTAGIDAATGLPYLVMELLEGEDLRRRIDRAGPLSWSELRVVFEQLAHALGAAHASGIVHRDIKPENVFLAKSNRATGASLTVKVLDFGIAKLLAETGISKTDTRGVIGSPIWMAPEQTAPGPVTPAADVWALGLVAYHALTGKTFWRASNDSDGTTAQLLREIVLDPIPRASERARAQGIEGRLSPAFDDWFARCVAREPEHRFADASLAWKALDESGGAVDVFSETFVARAPAPVGGETRGATPVVSASGDRGGIRPETPIATVQSAPPPANAVSARQSRAPVVIGAALAAFGVAVAAWFATHRGPSSSEAAVPAHEPPPVATTVASSSPIVPTAPIVPVASAVAVPSAIATTQIPELAKAPVVSPSAKKLPDALPGGFSDPYQLEHRATLWRVQGRNVRLLSRLVSNDSNVADATVRKAIEWEAWSYLRCYERAFQGAKELPQGIVKVSYRILDQLPQQAKLEESTFTSDSFNQCVVGTLLGQTINAAGPDGKGTATHAFKFLPVQ